MFKNRKIIISILIIAVVMAAAIFLPGILWKNHLTEISGKPESVAYSSDITEKGLTPKKFAEIYAKEGINEYSTSQTDPEDVLKSVKTLMENLLLFADEKTKITAEDVINVTNLVYYGESVQLINTYGGTSVIDMISTYTESYVGKFRYEIFLNFEKKTQMIIFLSINVSNALDNGPLEYYETQWMEELCYCADAYYKQLGIDENLYGVWYDPDNNNFTMYLLQCTEVKDISYDDDWYAGEMDAVAY